MASTLHSFTLYRGLTFGGLRLMALDASGAAVVISAGSSGLLQARRSAGQALAFALPVELGDADGEILIPEVDAATTAALPLGVFVYDLTLIDANDKPWGPFLHGLITVKDSVSVPA